VIIIYKDLIKKYINLLEPIHIKTYANNKNIFITNEEVNIIHNFIKCYYDELLESDSILIELKPLIREDLYNEVVKEYKENKVKYF
jgi:hypothetical protein